MVITSLHNQRVKDANKLRERRGRDQQKRIIIDGVREISRAVESGVVLSEAFVYEPNCQDPASQNLLESLEGSGVALIAVNGAVFGKLGFGNRNEGVIAIGPTPSLSLERLPPVEEAFFVVLESIEKPGNVGAVLRSADAVGVDGLIVASPVTDTYNPNTIRASLGAVFTVPVAAAPTEEVITWLRDRGTRICAARVDGANDYRDADYRQSLAIALGSETHGLSAHWFADEVYPVALPMHGQVDSLNVSATATVLMYEALRQRQSH